MEELLKAAMNNVADILKEDRTEISVKDKEAISILLHHCEDTMER